MNPHSTPPSASAADSVFATVRDLIESRQTVLPKRLVEPGPAPAEQLQLLLLLGLAQVREKGGC